jgi:hypothetical protein
VESDVDEVWSRHAKKRRGSIERFGIVGRWQEASRRLYRRWLEHGYFGFWRGPRRQGRQRRWCRGPKGPVSAFENFYEAFCIQRLAERQPVGAVIWVHLIGSTYSGPGFRG